MKIKLIALGKLKETYLKDGIGEYVKRMSRFCDTEILELPDEKIPDNPSESEEKAVLAKEAERIKKCIGQKDYVITLCVEGKQLSSEQLAEKMNEISLSGFSTITFIIGGSLGLDPEIKQLSHLKLSFSKFTFPHQLMRLILVEQVYRAFKINHNETYHK